MKKISILALHLGYGGIEKCIINLANLICEDYEVEILSTYKLDEKPAFEIDKRVKVTYLIDKYKPNREEWKESIHKIRPVVFFKETFKALHVLFLRRSKTIKAIKECKSDIIISTRILFNNWLGEYASRKTYKIGWEHNHHHQDVNYIKKMVNSCKNLDKVVLVSDSLRSFYKKELKKKNYKCKCVYIPNMLDTIPKKPSTVSHKNLISIGRLSREKGYEDLIEVYNIVHDKRPDWHLDIVGDGPEKNKIVDSIYLKELTSDVTVHGYLSRQEIDKLLNKSSIYLMTSYTESFGIVLIEAMSHGLPCIAFSSAEGANDLITNNVNGFLIENRDFNKMADAIIKLIDSKEERVKLGTEGRNISYNYTSDKIKKDWIQLLKRKD